MGTCYTFNSADLGTDPERPVQSSRTRNVMGCGKNKGLSIVLDRNELLWSNFLGRKGSHPVVYITVPDEVTHKVPFVIDPSFKGEHNFYVHGIHYITSSQDFAEWNGERMMFYDKDQRKLSLFESYTRGNCLLECKYNKTVQLCGCTPWYAARVNQQVDAKLCQGNCSKCFDETMNSYRDDQLDLVECDCRPGMRFTNKILYRCMNNVHTVDNDFNV